jgi:putative transcriptional regulator
VHREKLRFIILHSSFFLPFDMPIIVNLDVVLAQRKMRLNDLAEAVDITPQNLSILKTGKAKAIRFSTLEAICEHLECQPADILEYRPEPEKKKQPVRV